MLEDIKEHDMTKSTEDDNYDESEENTESGHENGAKN